MKTLNAKLFLDAINRAVEFQRRQPGHPEIHIALTEVRDAIQYAIESKPCENGKQPKGKK